MEIKTEMSSSCCGDQRGMPWEATMECEMKLNESYILGLSLSLSLHALFSLLIVLLFGYDFLMFNVLAKFWGCRPTVILFGLLAF